MLRPELIKDGGNIDGNGELKDESKMQCSLLDLSSDVEVFAFPKIKITASLLFCLRCSNCFKIKVLIYMEGVGGEVFISPWYLS